MDVRSSPRPFDRERIESLSTVVQGLTNYLPRHAAVVAHQYLMEALDCGDAVHAALALGQCASIEIRTSCVAPRVDRYLRRMRELAPSFPLLAGFEHLTRGTWLLAQHDYAAARTELTRVFEVIEAAPDAVFLSDLAHLHLQIAAFSAGDYAEIARTTPPLVQQMLLHGRAFCGTLMSGATGVVAWLVPDDPDAALRRIDEARRYTEPLSQQAWVLLVGEVAVCVYRGLHEQAFELLEQRVPAFEATVWQRSFGVAGKWSFLRGATAAALLPSATGNRRADLRAIVQRDLRRLQRVRVQDRGGANLLRAAMALNDGDRARAIAALQAALRARQGVTRAAVQRALGVLTGGEHGRSMVAEANAAMRAQGVVNPEAIARHALMGAVPVC